MGDIVKVLAIAGVVVVVLVLASLGMDFNDFYTTSSVADVTGNDIKDVTGMAASGKGTHNIGDIIGTNPENNNQIKLEDMIGTLNNDLGNCRIIRVDNTDENQCVGDCPRDFGSYPKSCNANKVRVLKAVDKNNKNNLIWMCCV